MYARLVVEYLKNFKIAVVERCDQALEYLRSNSVDGVILDVRLPDCNGMELIPEVKLLTKAPCVLVTGCDLDGDTYRRAITLGAAGFVLKPSGLQDGTFIETVSAFFQRK